MLTFKYEKKGSSVYTSHIDMLRVLNRVIRRADFKAEYSKGFNPHMLVFMSAPLATGISSDAEYLTLICSDEVEGAVEKFNKATAPTMLASKCFYSKDNPNVSGKTVRSSYFFASDKLFEHKEEIENILKLEEYTISFTAKGKDTQKEVRKFIYDLKVDEKGLYMLLAAGNDNLRADRLLKNILAPFGMDFSPIDINRLQQFVSVDGKVVDVDEYLESLQNK